MQPSIIQLYYGKLYPHPHLKLISEQYIKKRVEASERYEDFCRKLPDGLKKELDRIVDDEINLLPEELEQKFMEGFRIGARLALEMFFDISPAQGTERQR